MGYTEEQQNPETMSPFKEKYKHLVALLEDQKELLSVLATNLTPVINPNKFIVKDMSNDEGKEVATDAPIIHLTDYCIREVRQANESINAINKGLVI